MWMDFCNMCVFMLKIFLMSIHVHVPAAQKLTVHCWSPNLPACLYVVFLNASREGSTGYIWTVASSQRRWSKLLNFMFAHWTRPICIQPRRIWERVGGISNELQVSVPQMRSLIMNVFKSSLYLRDTLFAVKKSCERLCTHICTHLKQVFKWEMSSSKIKL